MSITSVTSFRFSAFGRVAQQPQAFFAEALEAVRRAARLERAAAEDLRAGALAPRPPSSRTCCSVSAEHGPAMTMTSSPPIRTSPTVTTVSSGLKVRLASLYGSRDAQHLVHAVEQLDQPGVGLPLPDGAEHRARDARSSGARPCPARRGARPPARSALRVARSSITTTMASVASSARSCHARSRLVGSLASSPCTTRRSSRRASSMMRSNSRAIASASSGPSPRCSRTCASTCFSRSG